MAEGPATGSYAHISPSTGAPAGGPLETIDQTIDYYVNTHATVAGQTPPVAYYASAHLDTESGASGDLTVSFQIILPRGYSYTSRLGWRMPVTYVNAQPSFTDAGDVTVRANAGPQAVANWATAISAGPADEARQTVSFVVTGNSNPSLFTAGPVIAPDGTLIITPAPGAIGSAQITVVLRDNGGTTLGGVDTSAPHTFTINVTAPKPNQAPTVCI